MSLADRWGDQPWSTPTQRDAYRAAFNTLPPAATVADTLAAFHTVPYEDSYDREMFFSAAAQKHGFTYEAIFHAWLHEDPVTPR